MGRASRRTAKEEPVAQGQAAAPRAAASRAPRGAAPGAGSLWSVPGLVLGGTLALLAYPPFLRGLYFTRDQLVTFLFTLLVFSLWWAYKLQAGDSQFFGSRLDYFALAAAMAWTLSVLVAVNPRGAIQEALKNANYFLIYWLVAEQVRSRHSLIYRNPRPILGALYVSALGVALVGMGAAAGAVHYKGAFEAGRIGSTIQYPNSLASYLTAAFFVGLALWSSAPIATPATWFRSFWRKSRTAFFAATASLIFLTFIFTLSRGGWLVFPVALVLFVILVGPGNRLKASAHAAAAIAAALPAIPLVARGVSAGRAAYVGLAVILAVLLGAGLGHLAELYLSRSVRWKVLLASGLGAVLVISSAALFGLAAARPLTLAHAPGDKDESRILEQRLSGLNPSAKHVLTFEVNATGDTKKPYAWRVVVYGYDPGTGANKLLADKYGKPTSGWQMQQIEVAPSQGLSGVTLQLNNYYAGTQATFRNVVMQSADGSKVAKPRFLLAKALPSSIYSRISDINLATVNAQSRLGFSSDALKVVRDYPLLGVGGRGWGAVFLKYQSYGYISREIHNHFVQTWAETGTIGFIAWVGLWGALVYEGLRLVRHVRAAAINEPEHFRGGGVVLGGVLVASLAIGIHSFIDFNLSLAAVSLYLWALIALVPLATGLPDVRLERPHRGPSGVVRSSAWLPLGAALLGLFLAGRLIVGYNLGAQAASLMKAGKSAEARNTYQKAIAADPWTASFRVDLGQLDRSIDEVQQGIARDKFNPQYQQVLGRLYLQQNKVAEGLSALERSVVLEPFQQQAYVQVAQVEYQLGEGLFQSGKPQLAKPLLERVLDLRTQAADRAAGISSTVAEEYRLNPAAPDLSLVVGRAQALLGQRAEAIATLANAAKTQGAADEANTWLAALYSADKNRQAALPYLAKVKARGSQAEERYADVYLMLTEP